MERFFEEFMHVQEQVEVLMETRTLPVFLNGDMASWELTEKRTASSNENMWKCTPSNDTRCKTLVHDWNTTVTTTV